MSLLPSASELASMRGVLDQFANCALTKVSTPGPVDEWDQPTTAVDVWTGSALAYIGRDFQVARGQGHNRAITLEQTEEGVSDDTLTILDGRSTPAIQAAIDAAASVLTIEDRRVSPPLTLTFRASRVRHEMYGLLDYLAIKLRDPDAP